MEIWPLKVRSMPSFYRKAIVSLYFLFVSIVENFDSLATEKVTWFLVPMKRRANTGQM